MFYIRCSDYNEFLFYYKLEFEYKRFIEKVYNNEENIKIYIEKVYNNEKNIKSE